MKLVAMEPDETQRAKQTPSPNNGATHTVQRFVFSPRLSSSSPSRQTRSVFTRIFLWIHRCMNTCNRSRLLFLSAGSRRSWNLHILYRADCPAYCVQPTAELLHIEHKLALLHDNESANDIEHVRLVTR